MNPKVANLIAVQFGIIIGLASWLIYSHLTPTGPHTTAMTEGTSQRAVVPAIAVVPSLPQASTLNNQRPYASNYPPQVVQPQVLEQQPVTTDQDNNNDYDNDQETTTQPYTNGYVDSNYFSATPNYSDPVQQPNLVPSDYYYDPGLYYPYYAVPSQVVVINDNHRFRNRFRTQHSFGAPRAAHQFPDRRNQIARPTGPPPTPQSFRPPGNIRPAPVQANVRPRRAVLSNTAVTTRSGTRATSFRP